MPVPQEQTPEEKNSMNTYVIDPESAAEMVRLLQQDQLMTAGMGGVFPEVDLDGVQRVLDLACGPGGWALDVAYHYSDLEVVGVDISERMIAYATAQAQVQQRNNVSFHAMNILQPLDFPTASFDLVNARFISGFMLQDRWPRLFREILRVLRPGGIVRLSEPEAGFSNKLYFEKALHQGMLAMHRAGLNFSPNGYHFGIVHMLPSFFRQAGIPVLGKKAHFIEHSFCTPAHEGFAQELTTALHLFEPLVVKTHVATPQEWQALSQAGLAQMYEEDFCAAWIVVTVWGEKPL